MNEETIKQLAEQLGQAIFNVNNWLKVAAYCIDDNAVFGGLYKFSGKEVKANLNNTAKQLSDIATTLAKECGVIN